ncbi:MAG: patatin-like phospholipase family protein [Candidatus Berkiella sp.]
MKSGSQDNLTQNPILSLLNSSESDIVKILGILKLMSTEGKIRPPKPLIKFPVFQGGGAKGGAYIGAYEALDKKGFLDEIVCPGGASAGGIVAFFMGLGFDGAQFRAISENLNFNDFIDFKKNGWSEYLSGHKLGNAIDLVRYGAVSPGKSFHQWASYFVEQVLGDKNATFRDLHEKLATDPTLKDMLFTATHYGTKGDSQAAQVFSFATTPDVVIADAFRATISYPGAFEPWQVRQKEIVDGKVTFKSLGFFADGGILNNLPLTCYNTEYYADPHYQNLERVDYRNQPVKVNPSVVGFSLTELEELNDDITPMTERVKALQQRVKKNNNSPVAKAQVAPSSWHLMDIAKAALWNTFGKPEAEDVADKQKIYFDQTVQVWPENVSTLEFDLARDKLARISANGKQATQLWLEKNRNSADAYDYKQHHDDRLTKQEEKQKQKDPEKFYFTKLSSLFMDLFKEIKKQGKIDCTKQGLLKNTRIRYLANQIIHFATLSTKDKLDVVEKAYIHAGEFFQQREMAIAQNRANRWDMIQPEKILKNICNKLNSDPKSAIKLIKSQLSNVIALAEQNQGQLLKVLVNTNNAQLTDKVLGIIAKALNQAYYHGKFTNPRCYMSRLLDNANPSLISLALQHDNLNILNILLKHGINVRHQNASTGNDALQEAVVLSHFAGFKKLVMECIDEENSFENIRIGKDNLWQYLFNHASNDFITALCHDNYFLHIIASETTDDNGLNILHHLAQKGTPAAFASMTYSIMADGVLSKTLLTNKDFRGQSPLAYIIKHNREDILQALVTEGKGKYAGYFTTGDFFLDHVFDIKEANRHSLHDLKQAYLEAPNLYRYLIKNLSSQAKADSLNNTITSSLHFGILDQPSIQTIELAAIHQEPVIFHPIFKKETKDIEQAIASLKKQLQLVA